MIPSTRNFAPASHLAFQAASFSDLADAVQAKLSAQVMSARQGREQINARAHRWILQSSALWTCSYGLPIRLKFPEGRDLRVQFRRKGQGATRAGRETVAVDEHQSCIYAGAAEVDFGEDFTQVAWRVPVDALERKLTALTGFIVTRPLEFEPVLNLQTPESKALLRVLDSLLDVIGAGGQDTPGILQSELESALMVALLCSGQHNFRTQLERDSLRPAPWQVRRAESFIEANWEKPITLEDIVDATGASARSVYRGFKEYRGYTPLQFVKHVRLQQAKRLLQQGDGTVSVTKAAMACGFADISRFSKDFSRAFGMPPSRVLPSRGAPGSK